MTKFILVLWCLMIFTASVFGQTLEADLRKSFNKHAVIKIDNQETLRKAKNRIPFKLETNDKTFQFILTPNNIRAENYKSEYTDNNGRHSLPRGEVFTYTGTLIGEKDSVPAFTDEKKSQKDFFSSVKRHTTLNPPKSILLTQTIMIKLFIKPKTRLKKTM